LSSIIVLIVFAWSITLSQYDIMNRKVQNTQHRQSGVLGYLSQDSGSSSKCYFGQIFAFMTWVYEDEEI
jgi:hypothetical protein